MQSMHWLTTYEGFLFILPLGWVDRVWCVNLIFLCLIYMYKITLYVLSASLRVNCSAENILAYFYILPHDSGMALWLQGCRVFTHLLYVGTYFRFQTITWVNINAFPPNLVHVCALLSWISGLGLLRGKFRQFLTVICQRHVSFFVPDNNE